MTLTGKITYERLKDIYSFLPLLLIFILSFNQSTFIVVIFMLVIFTFFNKLEYLLPLVFSSAFAEQLFPLFDGMSASRFVSLFLIVMVYSRYSKLSTANLKLFVLIFVIIIYNLYSALLSITGSVVPFFQMLQNLLILSVFLIFPVSNPGKVIKLLFYQVFLIVILLFFSAFRNGLNLFTLTERFSIDDNLNENLFALTLLPLAIVLFSFAAISKKKIIKVLGWSSYVCLIGLIVLTGSRGITMAAILSTALIVFLLYKERFFKLLLVSLFIIMIFFVGWTKLVELDIPFLQRFSLEVLIESRGETRFDLWLFAIENTIPNNFFLGVGLGGENVYAYVNSFGIKHSAHNLILDLFAQTGLIGFCLYMTLVLRIILNELKLLSSQKLIIVPISLIAAALIAGMGETVIHTRFFWYSLSLGLLIIQYSKNSILQVRNY